MFVIKPAIKLIAKFCLIFLAVGTVVIGNSNISKNYRVTITWSLFSANEMVPFVQIVDIDDNVTNVFFKSKGTRTMSGPDGMLLERIINNEDMAVTFFVVLFSRI